MSTPTPRNRSLSFPRKSVALLLVVGLTFAMQQPASAFTYSRGDAVVMVHGYAPFGCPGNDSNAFNPIVRTLTRYGWTDTGHMDKIGFYSCDTNVGGLERWIDRYGRFGYDGGNRQTESNNHNDFYSECSDSALFDPAYQTCWLFGWRSHESSGDSHQSHNRNTDIRHVAYHLAWYLYWRYSSQGRNVQLVGHSMGGVIIRYALLATQDKRLTVNVPGIGNMSGPGVNPKTGTYVFPPYLLVHDVVTLGTPHNGSFYWGGATPEVQAQQLASNSYFNKVLHINGAPRGRDGTVWTPMGSPFDEVVTPGSATDMCCTAVHRVKYDNPHYNHGGYLTDETTTFDADFCFTQPNNNSADLKYTLNGPRSLRLLELALSGAAWNWQYTAGC